MNTFVYITIGFFLACQCCMLVFFLKRGRERTAQHARIFSPHPETRPAMILSISPKDLDRLLVSARETEDAFVTIPTDSFRRVLEDARTAHTLVARLAPQRDQAVAV